MKKIILLITAISVFCILSFSQNVAINSTGAVPNASSMLDVSSTTGGMLIPRMTSAQKTAIATPATGLFVYDTTTGSFWYFDGTVWVEFLSAGDAWEIDGNAAAAADFIGTTNAIDFRIYTSNLERMSIEANGNVGIGTAAPSYKLHTIGDIYANGGWFRVSGNNGLYFQSWGGGFYMIDGTWIRTYGNKNFYHNTGIMRTDGTLQVGNGGNYMNVPNAGTGAVINEIGANYDFRVEYDARPAGFFLDASTEFAGLRWNAVGDPTVHFDVNGAALFGGDYATYRSVVGWYVGSEPLIAPSQDWFGYCGANGVNDAWYRGYSYGWFNASERKKKRDITPIDEDEALAAWVMNDIDKIKPSFYKYKRQKDEMIPGYETKYRPQMSLGVIVDEAPDYILDESFTAVDIYAIATLSLAGVKYNRKEIQEIKTTLGMSGGAIAINDFGSKTISGTEVWVNFSDDFSNKISDNIPVITITGNNPSVILCITEKNSTGFKVTVSENVSNFSFDWIAMCKVQATIPSANKNLSISTELRDKLKVPEAKKQIALDWWNSDAAKKSMKSATSNKPKK